MPLDFWIKNMGTQGPFGLPQLWIEVAGLITPRERGSIKLTDLGTGQMVDGPARVTVDAQVGILTTVPLDQHVLDDGAMSPAEHLAWLAFQRAEPMPEDVFILMGLKKVFHYAWRAAIDRPLPTKIGGVG